MSFLVIPKSPEVEKELKKSDWAALINTEQGSLILYQNDAMSEWHIRIVGSPRILKGGGLKS